MNNYACPMPMKCYREGKITRNPFLNFLRKYRIEHCGLTIIQIAVEGAKVWNKMKESDKVFYRKMAACAPPTPRKKRVSFMARSPVARKMRRSRKSIRRGRVARKQSRNRRMTLKSRNRRRG